MASDFRESMENWRESGADEVHIERIVFCLFVYVFKIAPTSFFP